MSFNNCISISKAESSDHMNWQSSSESSTQGTAAHISLADPALNIQALTAVYDCFSVLLMLFFIYSVNFIVLDVINIFSFILKYLVSILACS